MQWIKRASVLKADGTVEIKVPGVGSSPHEHHHVKCDEPHDEFWDAIHNQDIRSIKPLQIVMLIVGTRGDVQPFIAMGKRLQVFAFLVSEVLVLHNDHVLQECVVYCHVVFMEVITVQKV